MKIIILQDHLRGGGTERQSVLLARACAANGQSTTLLTFRPGGRLAREDVAPALLRSLQPFDTGLDWFAPGLRRTIASLAPDVVLCMGRMANCYAGRLQRQFPATAVIATMRTGQPLPWLFRRSLHRVRHVVANSRAAEQRLIRHHRLEAGRVSVIHNSLVFPPATSAGRDAGRRAILGAGPDTTVLLNVAMFRPEKNQRELIEIVRQLPAELDWRLWLAGEGPERARCEQLVSWHRLGARVKFLGFQRDATPLYRAADLAVHASRSESLSNFLIEAQAHGLPAVAYDAQGNAECMVPGDTGEIVAQGDRAAFVRAILRCAPPDAARSARARAFAAEHFDPSRQVWSYLDLFARLHGCRKP